MNAEHPAAAPPRAHWMRFGLRTAFVVVTLYCVWLAFVSVQARRQQKSLARIEELGGTVAFAFELDSDGMDWRQNPKPFVPGWIRRAVGEDYFRRVAIVNFGERSHSEDNSLTVLGDFPSLRQLAFSNRGNVTDVGLAHLAGLTQLKVLVLDGTGVTGSGLQHLAPLRRLEGLSLSNTPLRDEGLRHLAALKNLKWLHLNDTSISDEGLRCVAQLQCLENLQLVNTLITDAGLKHLELLGNLKRIYLRGTRTTDDGRAALQTALPNCRVPR